MLSSRWSGMVHWRSNERKAYRTGATGGPESVRTEPDRGSTFAAIQRFIETGEALCPTASPAGAGNGSLIRLAPVALRHLRDADKAEAMARLQSRCTHSAPTAADACAFLVETLRHLILGVPNALVPRALHPDADPEIAAIAGGSYLELRRLNPTGHVVRTLETALWAISHTDSFEGALVAATSLGGDADSISAVTGMLAGALYGSDEIPERWLRLLAWREEIFRIGYRLLQSAN